MAVSDVLKKFRSMPKPDEEDDYPEESSSPRVIQLTNDEVKACGGYKPGADVELKVSGRIEDDNHFHIMSVSPSSTMPDQEMGNMAAQVAGVDRAMPSPS